MSDVVPADPHQPAAPTTDRRRMEMRRFGVDPAQYIATSAVRHVRGRSPDTATAEELRGSRSSSAKRAFPREVFYRVTITFSQTLGTALGDWIADTGGLGYEGGALFFGTALAILALAYFSTNISRVALFWAAFILTRPLGATLGDFLDKPLSHGGFNFSRPLASAVIAAAIIACVLLFPQQPGAHPGQAKGPLTQ